MLPSKLISLRHQEGGSSFQGVRKMKITFHNYMGFPVQIIAEEPGKVIELPPEIPPFEIKKIERGHSVVAINTSDGSDLHVAIEQNMVSLKSPNGFPGPREGILYLVPQVIVEAVRKTNRSTTRDLIVPKQDDGIGPYRLHFANIITKLDTEDPDTKVAMYKTWQNSAQNMDGYKYLHESYASDR